MLHSCGGRFTWFYELFLVSYELVEDFGQPAEEKFERGHRIVRRDVGFGSSSVTTAGLIRPSASNTEMVSTKVPVYSLPTSSAGTTQKTGTKPESSTTGQPRTTTGAPSRSPETSSASSGATKPTGTTGRPEITTERTKKLEVRSEFNVYLYLEVKVQVQVQVQLGTWYATLLLKIIGSPADFRFTPLFASHKILM